MANTAHTLHDVLKRMSIHHPHKTGQIWPKLHRNNTISLRHHNRTTHFQWHYYNSMYLQIKKRVFGCNTTLFRWPRRSPKFLMGLLQQRWSDANDGLKWDQRHVEAKSPQLHTARWNKSTSLRSTRYCTWLQLQVTWNSKFLRVYFF